MARSGITGSRSEGGSQVGSSSQTHQTAAGWRPVAIEKREGGVSHFVIDALKVDGKVSSCSRGAPLSDRLCQQCKDVAIKCKLGIQCPALAKKIEQHLLSNFPKRADEREMAQEVFRFIKELKETGNLRATQVMETNLKPTENRVLFFCSNHTRVLQKLEFCMENLLKSKKKEQVEKEVPDFLKIVLKVKDPEKADIAEIVNLYKMLEEFQPFLQKARAEHAAATDAAAAAGDKMKLSMNVDSDHVDKFFATQKYDGDRAFMKAVLVMSCTES